MKNLKGTIKFYNTNLVKKTLATGAFILVADVSSYKPLTIICSVGAGLMISNIASKLKERRNESKTGAPKVSKRSIIIEKLKELKDELLENKPELTEKKTPVFITSKLVKESEVVRTVPVEKKEKAVVQSTPRNSDPLGEYIERQKQLKK